MHACMQYRVRPRQRQCLSAMQRLTLWPVRMLGCISAALPRADLLIRLLCLRLCPPESVFLPVWKSPTDSLSVFLSNCSLGRLSAASLLVSHLEQLPACQSVLLPDRFFFFFVILSACCPASSSG